MQPQINVAATSNNNKKTIQNEQSISIYRAHYHLALLQSPIAWQYP